MGGETHGAAMNLFNIVSGVIPSISPQTSLQVYVSSGYVTGSDGKRSPSYAPVRQIYGSIQALQYNDIVQLDGLNIQGERRKLYVSGEIDGLVRVDRKGGDLLIDPIGNIWLAAIVLEYWPTWTCVAITMQDQIAQNLVLLDGVSIPAP